MRIVRFRHEGAASWGVLDGQVVHRAEGEPFLDLRAAEPVGELGSVELLAPVSPRSVFCVGRNYVDHAVELGNDVPREPLIFMKPVGSVIGPDEPIVLPVLSERVEHEAEIVLVIGRRSRFLTRDDALSAVGGVTLGNDVTARDLQRSDGQWTRGKGFDTFCPIGPWIDTDADPSTMSIRCTVDDEVRQEGDARDMIFDVATVLTYITAFATLEPGDVVMTGTPAGVGPLAAGRTVTVSSPQLGELRNPIVAAP